MTITASGRSALILATGLWIGFATPLLAAGDATASSKPDSTAAATPDNSAKHGSRHLKKYAHPKSDKPAEKSAADAKAPDAAADDGDHSPTMPSSQMPPTVANANAELTSTDTPAGSAKAMSDRVNSILQGTPDNNADVQPAAGTAVVAADQLNDVDRALHEATPVATPPATPVALASADAPPPATSPSVAAASSDNSTWDQTSLIGKIFIGFGALLTMASAARMFMA